MIMTSNSIDEDSIRSDSPIVIDHSYRNNLFHILSCCTCTRKQKKHSNGFFQRIANLKIRKRQNSYRKQQFSPVSNGYSIGEIDQLYDEQYLSIELPESPFLRSTRSISFLKQIDSPRHFHSNIDTCSFADIEVASSITEPKSPILVATPKSFVSRNVSSETSNLSACSTQSLLRKLLDKAQLLDEYYKDFSRSDRTHHSTSQTSSSNSTLRKSNQTSRLLFHRPSSQQSDNSRFNLYNDEDNILRELIRFNNDIDLILSRLSTDSSSNIQTTTALDNALSLPSQTIINSSNVDTPVHHHHQHPEEINQTIIDMRTDTNELNIHSLLANDIDRLQETVLTKLLQIKQTADHSINETITLNKLHRLPKSIKWKGKNVFGVPLRIYQQTTGHILPIGIINALEYIREYAGKCDGLFRKPGVKSKIDQLRNEIERIDSSFEKIKFDEYQPFVVADVIRQYFRELPECLIPPLITRLLPNLLHSLQSEEQLLVIRYIFLLLSDETREVLQILLRFLFDVAVRLGNNQTTCRSLARIFLPSVFQSYYMTQQTTTKLFWWNWKKDKLNNIEQENERLILEQCLMTMIFNVDLLDRVPSALCDELKLSSGKMKKKLDELIRNECNGDFHLKKYISNKTEQFLQKISNRKFKIIPILINGTHVSVHKLSKNDQENSLPLWKCSIEIPNTNIKQVHHRLLYERYLWDQHFAEGRTIEKINNDKEILQYVLNSPDLTSIRSFCEFRFSKKVTSSVHNGNAILISSTSIDHSQNHFLPGNIGLTYQMDYYLTSSPNNSANTIITQLACVDYSGRSSQWYENFYGSLLAHHLISLRDTFTKTMVV